MGFAALDSVALQALAAAGATFAVNIDELATATDSVSAIATYNLSVSELATATDLVDYTFIPVQQPLRPIRDFWDRDSWGNFIPGSGYHH